jgi:tetratricopeptide (TPR) repeat protein
MQPSPPPRRRLIFLSVLAIAVLAGAVIGYVIWDRTRLPKPGSPLYEEYVDAFQIGTAALDSGSLNERAIEKLTEAIEKIPQEPAAWANRGICYLRMGGPGAIKNAAADLTHAKELAPDNDNIEELLGHLSDATARYSEAIAHFRKALAAQPNNVQRMYQLYNLLPKEASENADAERQELLDRIVQERPTSLFILAQRAELAIRRKDTKRLLDTLDRLEKLKHEWKADTRQELEKLNKAAAGNAPASDLIIRVLPFQNLLKQEAGYSRDANEIHPTGGQIGMTFQTFLRLPPVRTTPSPADIGLALAPAALRLHGEVPKSKVPGDQVLIPVWLNGRENPVILQANAKEVRRADAPGLALAFPSGAKAVLPTIDGVLPIDLNNDELIDLVLAGAGGLRFYRHGVNKGFEDITAKTKLPAKVLEDDYHGAWAADIEMDGDMDIILARRKGPPVVLRNNFDETFTALELFPGVEGARAFAWLDLDNDGAPDAAFLDSAGKLHVFMNKRSGVFQRRDVPDPHGRYAALAVADVNDDGVLDLIALRCDGTLFRVSDKNKGQSWDVAELGNLEKKLPLEPGVARLIAVDLDNNGAIDLIYRTREGGQVWLADGKGGFKALDLDVPDGTADVISLDGSGRLDFLGWPRKPGEEKLLARWTTQLTQDYHWQQVKTRASPQGSGDNRINSLCLGGEIEVRTGTLVIKLPIDRPVVRVGLGNRKTVAVMRMVWPNGAVQFEFDKGTDAAIEVGQRLKGSCPFLFTFDGKKMVFVADFCWSTPLGMYINAQNTGALEQTTDWVKIRGDQLAPRDGYFDIRVNANLWETHFLDHLSLMAVDRPPGTEVHVDERFFLTPTAPQLYLTGPSRPVARAWDHKGNDVTEIVRAIDGRYLDRAGRGAYQGITADHWVEVDLGEDAPKEGPVYLLAHGWIHPTDSSINLALEQRKSIRPMPLTLEIPDSKGGWKVGRPALGLPAGKNKTCVIRLDGIEGQGVTRRFRLRTNLEIYWDALHYAVGLDAAKCVKKQLLPTKADLRYRGLIRMSQANKSTPELPHYDEVICQTQYWRDLIGFHTRFGDIRELLEKIDDRYVIMNAGDEIELHFEPPPAPPGGWQRDFVWVCDGWVKDGDLNTRFGNTVLPLPYHGMSGYDSPPGRLQDDPVYRRFPKDWEVYHTRYVTPAVFERGLWNFKKPTE